MTNVQNNVLMVGWEYPPHNSGGLGVACQGLTEALARHQTQIYFTLPYTLGGNRVKHMEVLECIDPAWTQLDAAGQPPFFAYSTAAPELDYLFKKLDSHQLAALPTSQLEQKVNQYADKVVEEVGQHHLDFGVVHAHDWMSFPAAEQIKRETGLPMVAHVHSTEYDRIPNGQGSSYIKNTELQGLNMADKIIAVSRYTRQVLINHYGVAGDKIVVVHNGLPPLQGKIKPPGQSFATHRPLIVFMGRLTGQKGPQQFLMLAEELVRQLPEALLVMAGDGDMYRELLVSNAGRGLSTKVLFSGFVRDRQRELLLDRADIFVMPSLSEPFGLVALEAAQRHTPVIVSKTSGVSEVLPSALAVDFWDVQKMAALIQRLLADKTYQQTVVTGQLQELKNVTWDRAATQVQKIYNGLSALTY